MSDVFVNPSTAPGRLQAACDKYASPDPSSLALLPKPLKRDSEKGKCKDCGGYHGLPAIHLSYMGHADVTKALIDIDPEWTWEPAAMVDGAPAIALKGSRLVMWGYLCVLGVRRLCVGTCEAGKGDPEKELIGDLLRNGAMRFGVGVNLWSKADSADPASNASGGGYEPPDPRPRRDAADDLFDRVKQTKGTPKADELKALSVENGGLSLSARAFREDAAWAELVTAVVES